MYLKMLIKIKKWNMKWKSNYNINKIINENPDLNKDFIFLRPSHNFRSTEINAVLGLSQIKKLDEK